MVGPGGSSPLGTAGYVSAALELRAQIDAGLLPCPDAIYVALGSGGTAGGLALGCALAGLSCEIIAVRVVERALANMALVRLLMRRTRGLLRLDGDRPRITIRKGYLGRCYGDPTPGSRRACQAVADAEGLRLETTYTGKAMAALMDDCARRPGRTVLFWNTYNSQDTSALQRLGQDRPLPARIVSWLNRATPQEQTG